jgi:hypothetical protein
MFFFVSTSALRATKEALKVCKLEHFGFVVHWPAAKVAF